MWELAWSRACFADLIRKWCARICVPHPCTFRQSRPVSSFHAQEKGCLAGRIFSQWKRNQQACKRWGAITAAMPFTTAWKR